MCTGRTSCYHSATLSVWDKVVSPSKEDFGPEIAEEHWVGPLLQKKTAFQLTSTYLTEKLRIFPCITPLMLTGSWRHTPIVPEYITSQQVFISKREQQFSVHIIHKIQYTNDRNTKFTAKPVLQSSLILFHHKIQRHAKFSISGDNMLTSDHTDEKSSATIFIFHAFPGLQTWNSTSLTFTVHICTWLPINSWSKIY